MATWSKLALAMFARNESTGVTEQVDKTNDSRNALKTQGTVFQSGAEVGPANPLNVTGTVTASGATLNYVAALSQPLSTPVNLGTGAYSATTAIGVPAILSSFVAHFSVSTPKNITITDVTTGAVVLNLPADSRTDMRYNFNNDGRASGRQYRLDIAEVSPGGVTCNASFELTVGIGQLPMGGNPIVDGFIADVVNAYDGSLAPGASTTHGAVDVSSYSGITANVSFTPDVSDGATYTFQFSPDGTRWFTSVPTPIPNGNIVIPLPLRVGVWKYFQGWVTNGTTPVTCTVQHNLHHTDPGPIYRTGNQTIQPGDGQTVVRALIEPSFKGHLNVLGADRSIGGETISLPYVIQDVWQFDASFANNNIGVVTNGGATAAQSPANGAVLTLPNGATSSNVQLQGQKKNRYKPGREFRKEFSFGFPSAGVAGANCLAGLCDSVTPIATSDGPQVTYTATTIVDTNANFTAAGSGVTVGQTVKAGVGLTSTATITGVTATTITMSGGWTGGTPANFTPYQVNPLFFDPTTTGNGLYLGWVGTTFGFHIVSGGTLTSYDKGTWASTAVRRLIGGGDMLDGSGLSAFRQNGGPVALLLSMGNAYRIRGVWFGVGPVYLDVKSPDDVWIPAFVFHYPNTAAVPYMQNPNLFMLTTLSKSAVATTGYSAFKFCSNVGTVEAEKGFEPHEINGHVLVQRAASGITAASQLVHTVSPGRQYLVKDAVLSAFFSSGANVLEVRDGGSTGALRFAIQGGTNNSLVPITPSFNTPLVFYKDVTVVTTGGSNTWSGAVSGYEKEL